MNDLVEASRVWFAGYAALLEEGIAAMTAGEGLTEDFATRCQEFDEAVRALGGDALRAAAEGPGGEQMLASWHDVRSRFEAAVIDGRAALKQRLESNSRARSGLHGYARTGQWLKSTGGRYIHRSG